MAAAAGGEKRDGFRQGKRLFLNQYPSIPIVAVLFLPGRSSSLQLRGVRRLLLELQGLEFFLGEGGRGGVCAVLRVCGRGRLGCFLGSNRAVRGGVA